MDAATVTHQTHAVTTAQTNLRDTADAYDELDERLPGDARRGTTHAAPGSRPTLDLHIATIRMEIANWATQCARAVMDYRYGELNEEWNPTSHDPGDILRDIADNHIGVFLTHPTIASNFLDRAADITHRARKAAWPTGGRWIRLHVTCPEHGTSGLGERIPCGGEYRMWMKPDQDILGDMVCNHDDTHRITPAEWQQAMRRKGVVSADGAAKLARTLRLSRLPA